MNRIRLHRILPALALGALLMAPSAWAAPRGVAGAARAEGTWALSLDFFAQFWGRAMHWGSKNGPSIDPSGKPGATTMNGPTIDPNGGFPPGTKNGLGIDPNGGTSGTQSNPPAASSSHQDGICLLGSGCEP